MKNINSAHWLGKTTAVAALVMSSGCAYSKAVDTPLNGASDKAKSAALSQNSVEVKAGDLFVASDGTASNAGTQNSPTTVENALTRLPAGNTIWLRGGTYKFSQPLAIALGNNGTEKAVKRIYAYTNEVPVLDFSALSVGNSNRGFTLNGNFWHFKGLIVEHAGDNGIYIGGNDNVIELCETRFNADSGLQIGRAMPTFTNISQWPSNNLILNCTSHDNKDVGNENADGFACKLTAGQGNIFRGCIAHHNIDDGWDLFAKTETGPIGAVLIENCVAYNNGTLSDGTTSKGGDKNGFKLGGSGIAVAHTIRDSFAFSNGKHGFTDNNNPGPITVSNNIGFRNTESNFKFRDGGTHVFTANISLKAGESDRTVGTLTGTSNVFWHNKKGSNNNGGNLVVSEDDFVSLTAPAVVGRKADGSPDLGDFLRLKTDSDLIKLSATPKISGG